MKNKHTPTPIDKITIDIVKSLESYTGGFWVYLNKSGHYFINHKLAKNWADRVAKSFKKQGVKVEYKKIPVSRPVIADYQIALSIEELENEILRNELSEVKEKVKNLTIWIYENHACEQCPAKVSCKYYGISWRKRNIKNCGDKINMIMAHAAISKAKGE